MVFLLLIIRRFFEYKSSRVSESDLFFLALRHLNYLSINDKISSVK